MPVVLATAQITPEELSRLSREFHGDYQVARQAATRSVNRLAVRTRSRIVKRVAAETGLKQKDVREQIDIKRATFSNIVAHVLLTGRRIPLEAFGARGRMPSRGKGKGIRYKIGRKELATAFKARMKSGHVGVFVRKYRINASSLGVKDKILYYAGALHYTRSKLVDRKNRGGRMPRLPLHELKGLSVPGAFEGAPQLANQILVETNRDLVDEMLSQTTLLLNQKRMKNAAYFDQMVAEGSDGDAG